MNTTSGGLLARLEGFELDEPGAVLPFTARLARENGWTSARAGRVVREYKRFLFLSAAAGHPVSPPEDVDQAWHLHMVYTRSYWDRLCGEILGKPLHHEPTSGRAKEGEKFHDWYARTLESYQRLIGEKPPEDIWPSPAKRFAHAGEGRWVDRSQYWVVRKPFRFVWRAGMAVSLMALAAGAVTLLLTGCMPFTAGSGVMPWDWDGITFLIAYGLAFFLVALPLAIHIRNRRNKMFECPDAPETLIDPYEVAMLAKGSGRVIQTAVAKLVKDGTLVYKSTGKDKGKLSMGLVQPPALHPFESVILRKVRGAARGLSPASLFSEIRDDFAVMERHLAIQGLKPTSTDRGNGAWAVAAPFLILIVLGVLRILQGISNHRPVGFLVIFLFITFIIAMVMGSKIRRITPAGEALLNRMRQETQAPKEGEADPGFPCRVALLGVAAMAGMPDLQFLMRDNHLKQVDAPSSGGSGGCGSGCSSGCGGSGCGGGGCGGCGGGD